MYRQTILETDAGTELVFAAPLLAAFFLILAAPPLVVQYLVSVVMGIVLYLSHKTKEKNVPERVQYISWYDPVILAASVFIGMGSPLGRPFLGDAVYHALELAFA